jgi:hypothetical protein
VRFAIVIAVLVAGTIARADPQITTGRRALAIGAAVFPGVVVRGAGSWIVHERPTAKRLFGVAGVGVGAIVVGALPVGLAGASERVMMPGVPLIITGAGLFFSTWIADIWTAAGGRGGRAHPIAPYHVELGTVLVADPVLDGVAFAHAAASFELPRFRVAPSALIALDSDVQRLRLDAAWRVRAPVDGDGTRIELRAATGAHRTDPDGFLSTTIETSAAVRIDGHHLADPLAGTFVELELGVGLELTTYDDGLDAFDVTDLLIGRFAWGAYLGCRGELAAFYDHRRDTLAGGFPAWRAAGFVGSFGVGAHVAVADRWTVVGEAEVGTAWVGTLAVRWRGGEP